MKRTNVWWCEHDPTHSIKECPYPNGTFVPTDHLRGIHYVRLGDRGYQLTHPIDCDLDECMFEKRARRWEHVPASPGRYEWQSLNQDPSTWNRVSG